MRQRRFSKPKKARQIFLVICEGETEAAYVEMLRGNYRLPITIKTKVSGNQISKRLVDQYVAELGVTDKDEYRVFYIYDADVAPVAAKIKSLDGLALLSDPCIELWFLLHFCSQTSSVDSKGALAKLCELDRQWNAYAKGHFTTQQKESLMARTAHAVARAKRLPSGHNPSTNLYEFIEILEAVKNG